MEKSILYDDRDLTLLNMLLCKLHLSLRCLSLETYGLPTLLNVEYS